MVQLNPAECEVTLRENISSEVRESATTGPEAAQITVYLADEYTIITPWREGLEAAVNGNTAAWLDVAKNTERTQLTKEAREHRNKLLADIDWTQTIDAPISAANREALRKYRQELRDITEAPDFPYNIAWPERPAIEKGDPDPVDEAVDVLLGGDNNA